MHQLIDRGADRAPRFCVVMPLGLRPGTLVSTDRGAFPITHVGRPYQADGGTVAYHYFDIDPRVIGAPAEVTPQVLAQRARQQAKAIKRGAEWRAAHPQEVAANNAASGARLRAWRKSNPEAARAAEQKRREGLKAWRASHPKEVKAIAKKARTAAEAKKRDRGLHHRKE